MTNLQRESSLLLINRFSWESRYTARAKVFGGSTIHRVVNAHGSLLECHREPGGATVGQRPFQPSNFPPRHIRSAIRCRRISDLSHGNRKEKSQFTEFDSITEKFFELNFDWQPTPPIGLGFSYVGDRCVSPSFFTSRNGRSKIAGISRSRSFCRLPHRAGGRGAAIGFQDLEGRKDER